MNRIDIIRASISLMKVDAITSMCVLVSTRPRKGIDADGRARWLAQKCTTHPSVSHHMCLCMPDRYILARVIRFVKHHTLDSLVCNYILNANRTNRSHERVNHVHCIVRNRSLDANNISCIGTISNSRFASVQLYTTMHCWLVSIHTNCMSASMWSTIEWLYLEYETLFAHQWTRKFVSNLHRLHST